MKYKGCYMAVAGKKASADGSVLVARSLDAYGGDDVVQVLAEPRKKHESGKMLRIPGADGVTLPQAPETNAYLGVMMVGVGLDLNEAEGGVNEHQVVAGTSSGGYLNPKAGELCKLSKTSVGDYRMTLVLERCKTAREGVELIGQLTDKYGARTDNYIVADPKEIWWYEEFQDHLWAAVRVPDDCFAVQANTVRIDYVDLNDSANYLGSHKLISFAKENGLYEESDGPFNPAKVYGAQTGKSRHGIPAPEYDRRRVYRGMSLLKPSLNLDPDDPSWTYPLFVKPDPDKKITPQALLALWEDHYEGTPYDHYGQNRDQFHPTVSPMIAKDNKQYPGSKFHINNNRQYQLAPIWGTERIIGTPRAVTEWVAQLRDWMPNPVGGLIWTGIGEGATTGRMPFYCGITRTPEPFTHGVQETALSADPHAMNEYNPRSASWRFRIVTNLVNLFYTATKDEVIPVWRKWEENLFKLQPAIEKVAVDLYNQDPELAVDFLTTYSCMKASEALEMVEKMIRRLHTIISHYNAPL